MPIGGVIHDKIGDDAHPQLLGVIHELDELSWGAVRW
jgi:hypothetical protein